METDLPPLRNVLVIEDEFAIAYDVEHALLESGLDVVDILSASTCDPQHIERLKPDFVLVNFRLSRSPSILRAVGLLKRLKIPLVILSTHIDQARSVLRDLAAVYVQQPLTPHKLRLVLQSDIN